MTGTGRGAAWGVASAWLLAAAMAPGQTLSFSDAKDLAHAQTSGAVSVDTARDRSGGPGGSLKIEPGGQVTWRLRQASGAGKVELWVYEDTSAPPKPKAYAAGPMWGLTQSDASVLAVGPIYAPYLSGDKTYATADFTPGTDERPWQQVQYLGLKRSEGWHKWTFDFTVEGGLVIMHNDTDVNARRAMFNWQKTRLLGLNGIILTGGSSAAKQTLWVDDVSVTLGPEGKAAPLWPPPPPKDVTVVPPQAEQSSTPYARWPHGPGQDPNYFPIAVWLQAPANAKRYKAAGINMYVGLWKGPTEEQLTELREAGMPVICAQNDVGLKHAEDPLIVGWMHGDEPDNAHKFAEYWGSDKERIKEAWPEIYESRGLATKDYKGYGPSVPPKWIVRDYAEIKKRDSSRPVLVNLGQGVAWDDYVGRGERRGHLEDYPEYVKGCDIVSYDICPAVHSSDEIRGNLWYVAKGVGRLRRWTADRKPVWNCIECTRISNTNVKPTPHQVRAEVWMSIIHGSRGLVYFVHQFKPTFIEAALLAEPELLAAVAAVNAQVRDLAPVINSPVLPDGIAVVSSSEHTPVHAVARRHGGDTYVFAVAMYQRDTRAGFTVRGAGDAVTVEVIGEDRTLELKSGGFSDDFRGYDVHLYRIPGTE